MRDNDNYDIKPALDGAASMFPGSASGTACRVILDSVCEKNSPDATLISIFPSLNQPLTNDQILEYLEKWNYC